MIGKFPAALLIVIGMTASLSAYAEEPSVQGLQLGMTIEAVHTVLGDVKFDEVSADDVTKVLMALRSASEGFVIVTIMDKLVFVQYERIFALSDAPNLSDMMAAVLAKYGVASVDGREQQTWIFDQTGRVEMTDGQSCARRLDLSGTLSPAASKLYLKYPKKWLSGCFSGLRTQIRSVTGDLVDDYRATLWTQEPGIALMQDRANDARREAETKREAPPKRAVPPL